MTAGGPAERRYRFDGCTFERVRAHGGSREIAFARVLSRSQGPLRFVDLRFHAHDPLYVFDADGDGIDDLAARGHGDRSGGLTIMRLDMATKRLVRLVSGFAWEQ